MTYDDWYDEDDPEDEREGAPDEDEPEDDDDGWQEYKDGVAMGYINKDGTQREPDEPDWQAVEEQRHLWEFHGGEVCNCPPPGPGPRALAEGETYETGSPF